MKAVDICLTAAGLIGGERAEQHGDMHAICCDIAALWSTYTGCELEATDVCNMMIILKMMRDRYGKHSADNFIDMAGYAGMCGEISERLRYGKQ